MARLRLIHWNEAEAKPRIATLRKAGHSVSHDASWGGASFRKIRERPPQAVVIDLTRLPSHGREIAMTLRTSKSTRHVPLVFVDGDPAKVRRIRDLLPDAAYTTWSRVRGSITKAIEHPPKNPVVPSSNLAGYSGTPLSKKLGIKSGCVVGLVGAPPGFEETLGALPNDVTLRRSARGTLDLVIWFVSSASELRKRVKRMGEIAGGGGLWIAWPKKASGVRSDLDGNVVRRTGLSSGLVDYKVCAIDETWSGLRFAKRK